MVVYIRFSDLKSEFINSKSTTGDGEGAQWVKDAWHQAWHLSLILKGTLGTRRESIPANYPLTSK